MLDLTKLSELLGRNENFVSSTKYFDGSIQLNLGKEKIWIKAFMGRVILVTQEPPPFGFTFAIEGPPAEWRWALGGAKNRFREALMTGRLAVQGNRIEFSRIGKAVHGLSEVLRRMLQDGSMRLGEGE
jgi:putative sterol carrier protein